ncbi:HNH endonuclease [Rhodococcus sp. PAMC28707]|uniref:HNH endonuclease signature motif containing protein n=1 Tax=unclassified Rhodococcus (in: high G+C Gram-positive bacteria) TaxID=192944 RepID=UPI00109D8D6C|nr:MULTISPECIES: HNH endonuclease signature motif containing protein [unclassified Rhodococcus (in: high G+C Gram-positive bacteria)]QCB49862.1 HNH endonuclease [Rhodococcus sp. PAMC28705]QCB58445.1 HNH endonuclease [Rhodococcus sp. PAMC28707]
MHELGDFRSADALSDQEIVSGISDITHAENNFAAQKYALLAEFSRRGLNVALKYSTPTRWLASGTRVADGNAARQFDTANWLTHWPAVSKALTDGDIHVAHVREIYDGYTHIRTADPTLGSTRIADIVDDLLGVAFDATAAKVQKRAHELAHAVAHDARARYDEAQRERQRREDERREQEKLGETVEPEDQYEEKLEEKVGADGVPEGPPPLPASENPALNRFDLYLQSDGRTTLIGDVDKILAEKLRAVLSPLSKPQPEPDATLDTRSPSKRQADALSELLDAHLTGNASEHGTSRPQVNVTVNLRDLLSPEAQAKMGGNAAAVSDSPDSSAPGAELPGPDSPDWPFRLGWTGPISKNLAELLSCDADLTPIIIDHNGIPLAMGRSVRLGTTSQRTAVILRDRCCVMCGRPADWCLLHHVVFWRNGGPTDVNNLALVCSECHRAIHNDGWEIAFGDDGHPVVTPPADVDPHRKPRPSYHRRRKPAM